MDDEREFGRVAYEAYGVYRHWTTVDGLQMPPWDELDADVRDAWRAVAAAVVSTTCARVAELVGTLTQDDLDVMALTTADEPGPPEPDRDGS